MLICGLSSISAEIAECLVNECACHCAVISGEAIQKKPPIARGSESAIKAVSGGRIKHVVDAKIGDGVCAEIRERQHVGLSVLALVVWRTSNLAHRPLKPFFGLGGA